MVALLIHCFAGFLALIPRFLASTPVAGSREIIGESTHPAVWLLFAGLLILAAHVGVFAARATRNRSRNSVVLFLTIASSVLAVPLTLIGMFVSGFAQRGFSLFPPLLLAVFELYCMAVQVISWRYITEPSDPSILPLA